jgi:hypothetical protein
MGQIIPFPGTKLSTEQRKQNAIEETDNLIVDIALDISLGVFNRLDGANIPTVDNIYIQRDLLLIHEAIKSTVSRIYGRKHSLQEYAMENIDPLLSDITFQSDEDFE